MNASRQDTLSTLKVDGMSRREIRLRHVLLSRKYYPNEWVERYNFSKAQSERKLLNVANDYTVLRS